jgi:phage terminase small subunit
MKPLNPKQQAFVREYLVDLNASAAYRRAGYKSGNADVCGPRLLGKAGIRAALESAMQERANRVEVTADQVLARLWLEANRQGKGASHAARIRALELVGRNVGMKFTEVHELSGPGGGPIETVDAKEKLLGRLSR